MHRFTTWLVYFLPLQSPPPPQAYRSTDVQSSAARQHTLATLETLEEKTSGRRGRAHEVQKSDQL
jgi:hypothetical protein